jgi:GDP-L-fucose synthase
MNKKSILITGANGMVGKNIANHYFSKKYNLLLPSKTELNLLDKTAIKKYLRNNNPDFVIHAAGVVGGIQANIDNPVKFLVDNTEIGINIITAAYEEKIANLINMSSSCMYPKYAENPLKEELILTGSLEPTNEGYALAKITSTKLCEYINKENDYYKYKTVIPCNLYGKYDKFDPKHSHMLPAVIKKIYEAKNNNVNKIDIWGDGLAKREFMYVEDLADFIYYSINNFNRLPQNINIGLGYDYTIKEYYNIIAKIIEYKGTFYHDLSKPTGMKQKLMDISKLNTFGWKHKTSLEEGIKKTYKYFLETYHEKI